MNKEFITKWMVSPLQVEPFSAKRTTDDQLIFEKHMRECVADKQILMPDEVLSLWESPMQYLVNPKNWFVDFSDFYHLTKKIQLNAKTVLAAKQDMNLEAVLWTYASIQIYVNGSCVCSHDTPVYKPIHMQKFTLPLKQGENRILVRMQNLGVRDTRNIFGIQIPHLPEQLSICLPQTEHLERIMKAEEWLYRIVCRQNKLYFDVPACESVMIKESGQIIESGFTGIITLEDLKQITLSVTIDGLEITRLIELGDQIKPLYLEEASPEAFYRYIANINSRKNHEAEKYTIYLLLASYAIGQKDEHDNEILLQQLDLLDTRIDCADFIVNGFLRFMHCYELDETVQKHAKKVLLNFRYWMNEDGEDGMCFWSENHSILFYASLLLASRQYPDDIFYRSGLTGREQYQIAQKKVLGWLEESEQWGFEEFLSGGYTVVTVAALLNLVDFAETDISNRAAAVIDRILITLAKHTYRGSVISPEGRVYRDVIYPFTQGLQSLIHYINPSYPISSNIWMASFATTKYQMPDHLVSLMENPCEEIHDTGNAQITLYKKQDYILTSVASPREDSFVPWQNTSFDPDVDRNSVRYTKSINERFHGTTCFQPGVYGYQQHLWYAALDSECVVFTNHPGENTDRSSMRPAYWYGNGIFPAVKQRSNCLGTIYRIPDHYPIHFTHLYFPESKFDEVKKDGLWIFAKKDDGYLGIWANRPLKAWDDVLIGCEYRSYGSESAYVCLCGSRSEHGSFDQFISSCMQKNICFDDDMLLSVDNEFCLKYEEFHNKTQYI